MNNKKALMFLISVLAVIIVISVGFIIINKYKLVNLENKNESTEKQNVEDDNSLNNSQDNNQNQINYEVRNTDFTLVDQYGNKQRLIDYRGQKVVLVFWAVWCPPCKEEIPIINDLSEEYDGAAFLTIVKPEASGAEGYNGYKDEINGYIKDNNITMPVLIDENDEVFNSYNIESYPSIVFVDEYGNVKNVNIEQSGDLIKQEIIEKLDS